MLQWVLIKGGHLSGPEATAALGEDGAAAALAAGGEALTTDVLFDGKNMMELSEPYIRLAGLMDIACLMGIAYR